jgi:hypothetical protein
MGPFHTMVRAREISSENSSMVFGPMSSAIGRRNRLTFADLRALRRWPPVSSRPCDRWATGTSHFVFGFVQKLPREVDFIRFKQRFADFLSPCAFRKV